MSLTEASWTLINTYSMKQPDRYYVETIKMTSKPGQILYGEYEPQASILCELWLGLWRLFMVSK